MYKPTVVFDFDGVIHSYKSGWKGIDNIPDEPVEGIKEVIEELRNNNYKVVVVSTRCSTINGILAVNKWLDKYGIKVDNVQMEKPPAKCYIDDRSIKFNPKSINTLFNEVKNFTNWIEDEEREYK